MLIRFAFFCFVAISTFVSAQTGGNSSFSHLNFVPSARINSLGGNLISVKDNDVNLAFQNPALLSKSASKQLAFNYCNYIGDINYGLVGFSPEIKKDYQLAFALQSGSYGKFIETDESGNKIDDFKAVDYSLNSVFSKRIDSLLSIGVNLKTLYSHVYTYDAFAAAVDLGLTYTKEEKFFAASIVLKNIGYQIDPLIKGTNEKLPFEIQGGLSKKLKKAPIRFSIVAEDMQKWKLNNNARPDTSFKTKFLNFGDNLARHAIVGAEILLTKNFNIRLGFNFQRRQELKVLTKPGIAGLTFGFGFKLSKFHLSYGRAQYNVAGVSNLFSITTNISDFSKK